MFYHRCAETMSSTLIFILITMMLLNPARSNPIVMNLMHVDSMHSPMYNPNTTVQQRATDALQRSMHRLKFLKAEAESKVVAIPVGIVLNKLPSVYFIQLEVGQPALKQSLVLDTGSSFPWIYGPNNNSRGPGTYNPLRSKAYIPINCRDEICTSGDIPSLPCGDINGGSCNYIISYLDNSESIGFLVKDAISFIGYPNHLYLSHFGCELTQNTSERRQLYDGILGLGYASSSLMSQWGYKEFSYCFSQNISDIRGEPPSGVLLIGSESLNRSSGWHETTIVIKGHHYYVTIVGMKVLSGSFVPLESLEVIMDTGSELTYLPPDIVDMIRNSVKNTIGEKFKSAFHISQDYCYNATLLQISEVEINETGFRPLVSLQFSSGVYFDIYPENAFRRVTARAVCLAILPSPADTHLIGAMAQQAYSITFAPEQGLLRFANSCGSLQY